MTDEMKDFNANLVAQYPITLYAIFLLFCFLMMFNYFRNQVIDRLYLGAVLGLLVMIGRVYRLHYLKGRNK